MKFSTTNIFHLTLLFLTPLMFGCSSQSRVEELVNSSYSDRNLITLEQSAMIARKYFVSPSSDKNDKSDKSEWINQIILDKFNSSNNNDKKQIRNDLIDELFILSDYNYNNYKINISQAKKSIDLGTDMYSLLLTGAAALTTGGNTPNILAGIATFITGTKESFDKTLFAEQTIDTLINIMDGRRMELKVKISSKKERNINEFSLLTAIREIIEMHHHGNVLSALSFMQEKSAAFQQEQTKKYLDTK
ncbi:hypothetical protein Sden_2059 [Shewanella denitrificans OS217]|jgi:hypothetical protein|uniref:Lipoprotein n=1 Tax=Shewanella denitrificans (strain OS217 / ATCC BAA-1090 / DSM 15013) TaxID=318161 RepID=Q12MI5_SHEDO|nr:hypothetical protein [Shewanella denitrificans]ABE55341.1 hypothetical protein Sden_2059 [Shewanella denitrificans OS217]